MFSLFNSNPAPRTERPSMSTQEWTPGALLEMSGYYWQTCALHAGVKLDLFTTIGATPTTAAEASERVRGSRDGIERLLNALAAMGLLSKDDGRFVCPPSVRRLLAKGTPDYVGHMILHHHHLMESWARLDQSVSTSSFSTTRWTDRCLPLCFRSTCCSGPRPDAPIPRPRSGPCWPRPESGISGASRFGPRTIPGSFWAASDRSLTSKAAEVTVPLRPQLSDTLT